MTMFRGGLWGTLILAMVLGCARQLTVEQHGGVPVLTIERQADEPTGPEPAADAVPPSGEGMWPWTQIEKLDGEALKQRGLKLALGDIWTPGKGGLARAVAGLSGCSASFVSADGLLLTNHHCAYRAIQRNSTPDNNLLEKGFLARSKEDELDGHGLKTFVFAEHRDVTDAVLGQLPEGLTDLARTEYIEAREKEIVKKCEEQPNTRCRVSRNNDGLSFTLLSFLELRDVRLVAAPPSALGNFGGEIDNWHWPRHTMDFALLRAYVDPQGRAAPYAEENVPFKPQRFFRIAKSGVAEGDLVMVMGTPGHTQRYRTSVAVEDVSDWYYPKRVAVFTEWAKILEQTCAELPDSCLLTSSTLRGISNGLTNAQGMIVGLKRAGVLERKRTEEERWRQWVAADGERQAKFGGALDDLMEIVKQHRAGRDRDFLIRYIISSWSPRMLGFARTITKWASEQQKPDEKREPGFQERDRENLRSRLDHAQRSLHLVADRRALALFLRLMGELPENERLQGLDKALNKDWRDKSIDRFLKRLYKKSQLGQREERLAAFDADLNTLKASKDSLIKLAFALFDELDQFDDRQKQKQGALSRLRPRYIESLVAMKGNRFYPDANGSPRISFATVAGYRPRDGVRHTPFTTLDGLVDKFTGKAPFDAPPEVIEAIEKRDLGAYRDPVLNDVPVCFLSNADTTGGNSGSPAVDGQGRLVGLNFDRVYENIAGDFGYNPPLSRNIMVDARVILWYLDRVARADHLLRELGL